MVFNFCARCSTVIGANARKSKRGHQAYEGLLPELKSIEGGCLFFALGKLFLRWVDRSNAKIKSIFIVTSPRILGGCIFEHATCTYKNGGPAKIRGEFNRNRLNNLGYDKCRVRSKGVKSRVK